MNKKKTSSRWKSQGGFNNRPRQFNNQSRGRNRKPDIDITSFIQQAQQAQPVAPIDLSVTRTFAEFNLQPQLKANIEAMGFSQPTPIQDRVMDQIGQGQNVLGIANTGTGKTGAFLIPAINRLLQDPNHKILVVAPTRELATQIDETFQALTKQTRLRSVQSIGGVNITRQIRSLQQPFNALIGTPGRIIDLVNRQILDLGQFKVVVLDEVDRMLDMGFINDIRKILAKTPTNRQSLYFSATVSQPISKLINDFSKNVYQVSVKTNETADSVNQEVIKYQHDEQKIDVLHDILISQEVTKVLIFGRTKHGVKKLMFQLRERGFRTDSIHGNKTQNQRQKALLAFRQNQVNILVATDVAARGLDIDDVTHVINYEIPESYQDYVHRIGRTGRGGKKGVAYTFVK